jgi:hypothetical protein
MGKRCDQTSPLTAQYAKPKLEIPRAWTEETSANQWFLEPSSASIGLPFKRLRNQIPQPEHTLLCVFRCPQWMLREV